MKDLSFIGSEFSRSTYERKQETTPQPQIWEPIQSGQSEASDLTSRSGIEALQRGRRVNRIRSEEGRWMRKRSGTWERELRLESLYFPPLLFADGCGESNGDLGFIYSAWGGGGWGVEGWVCGGRRPKQSWDQTSWNGIPWLYWPICIGRPRLRDEDTWEGVDLSCPRVTTIVVI